MNKYLNEAIIGNSRILATFSYKGEMLRLSYPNCDNRQYLNYFHTGVKVNDSNIIYLHDDINNTYLQYYDVDTNILNTEITNTYFNLKIVQTDFVSIKEDILIKKYSFINESHIEQNINFLIHSELLSDQNNFVSGMELDNGMVQFAHDFSVATFAKSDKLLSCQINNSQSNIATGIIGGKDYIGMSKDSSISFDIGLIHPGERKDIEICIYIDEKKKTMNEFIDEVERIKKIDLNKEYNDVKAYWRKYVKEHDGLKIGEPQSSYDEKIIQIYKRSILLFPLLTNFETGGIIAAAEVDENLTQCGRYAYCWPRDAVFMTKALDILKMNDISNATLSSYVGFSDLNKYTLEEALTKNTYLLDNGKFDKDFANNFNFGTTAGFTTTAYDFTIYAMQILTFIIAVFCLFFGAGLIAGEFTGKTMKMLAIRPYTRNKIYLGKLLACVAFMLILLLISFVASFVVGAILYGVDLPNVLLIINATSATVVHPMVVMLIYLASSILNLLFYISLALLLSVVFRSSTVAVLTSFIVYVVTILCNMLMVTVSWFKWLPIAHLDIFKYFGGASSTGGFLTFNTIIDANLWLSFGYILGIILVFNLASLIVFKKRNIT